MDKIALICDSTSDLKPETYSKYNIKMLPFKIIYKNKEYLDRIDISPSEVYARLEEEIPTTSLPDLQTIDDIFTQVEKEGFTHAIVISISSGLSGTFNAVNLIAESHPNLKIHVFDSRTLSIGTGLTVLKCAQMIEAGADFDTIVKELPIYQSHTSMFFVIDTLVYLKAGGRIGKVAGTLGELLNIKPIISVNDDGVYYVYSKARGKKQGLNKLVAIVKEALAKGPSFVCVMHGGAEDQAKLVYSQIKDDPNLLGTYFSDISPTAGVHTGAGLVGVAIAESY
ncbi:MAG: DegV family protein [Clostridium sp.]|uniref:DegV family protein n=1 Tax=Clostridium sp. TaxID=1506 RepID=UPI002A84B509|nr:DegV family protein [Clostridium sp.]MDY5097487.1 DegV family protein [Clostridium sp.]